MEEKILITGGAGFIGSHVTDELINAGKKVIVLDDLSGGFTENVNTEAEFIHGSIMDYDLLNKIFNENKITHIYHLAAYAAEGLSHFIKRFNYNNNLIGSVNLINLAVIHNVKCFVFTSSIAVYGKNQLPMSEDMMPIPEDSYGIAKYAVEQELLVTHEMFGLDYVIFRPHNVYGERQNIGDKYRNVIGIFINQIMSGLPMSVFGDGTQTRAFSHIRDVAPIIARSGFMPSVYGEVFNVGADKDYTVKELAYRVAGLMGVELNIQYLQARNEVKHAFSSHEKVRKFFNIEEEPYSLDDGLKLMVEWAKTVGAKKSQDFENIEIMKNMPPSWVKS